MESLAELCIEKWAEKLNIACVELPDKLRVKYNRQIRINEMKKLLADVNILQIKHEVADLIKRKNVTARFIYNRMSEIKRKHGNCWASPNFEAYKKHDEIFVGFTYNVKYKQPKLNSRKIHIMLRKFLISERKLGEGIYREDVDYHTYRTDYRPGGDWY